MADSVAVDPFASDNRREVVRVYKPDPKLKRILFCDCPRFVRLDGSIVCWHQPDCRELQAEALADIL